MSKSSLIAAVTKESSTFFNKNKTINSRNSEKNNNNGKERNNNNKKLSATTPTATEAGRKLPSSPVTQGITANDVNAKKSFKRNDQLIIGHYLHENDFAYIDEDDDNNNINRNNIINNCNEMNNYEINLKLSNNNNNNNNVVIKCNGKTLNNNNNLKNKNLIAIDDGQQLIYDEHDRDDKNDVNDRNNVLNKANSNKDEENLVKVVVADTKSSTAIHRKVLEHPRHQQKVNQLQQNQLQYQPCQQNNHQQQQQPQQQHQQTVDVVSNAGKKCKKQSDIKCKSQGFSNNNINNKNNISSWSCSCFSCINDKDNGK